MKMIPLFLIATVIATPAAHAVVQEIYSAFSTPPKLNKETLLTEEEKSLPQERKDILTEFRKRLMTGKPDVEKLAAGLEKSRHLDCNDEDGNKFKIGVRGTVVPKKVGILRIPYSALKLDLDLSDLKSAGQFKSEDGPALATASLLVKPEKWDKELNYGNLILGNSKEVKGPKNSFRATFTGNVAEDGSPVIGLFIRGQERNTLFAKGLKMNQRRFTRRPPFAVSVQCKVPAQTAEHSPSQPVEGAQAVRGG